MTQHHAISSSRPTASHGSTGSRAQQAGSTHQGGSYGLMDFHDISLSCAVMALFRIVRL